MCIFFLPPHCPFNDTLPERKLTTDELHRCLTTNEKLESDLLSHIEHQITAPSNTYINFCCKYVVVGAPRYVLDLNHSPDDNPFLCTNPGLGGIQIRHQPNERNEVADLDDCQVCTELARHWQKKELARLKKLKDGDFLKSLRQLASERSHDMDNEAVTSDDGDDDDVEVEEYMEPLLREIIKAREIEHRCATKGNATYEDHLRRYQSLADKMLERPGHQNVQESVCACVSGNVVDKLCGKTREK